MKRSGKKIGDPVNSLLFELTRKGRVMDKDNEIIDARSHITFPNGRDPHKVFMETVHRWLNTQGARLVRIYCPKSFDHRKALEILHGDDTIKKAEIQLHKNYLCFTIEYTK